MPYYITCTMVCHLGKNPSLYLGFFPSRKLYLDTQSSYSSGPKTYSLDSNIMDR